MDSLYIYTYIMHICNLCILYIYVMNFNPIHSILYSLVFLSLPRIFLTCSPPSLISYFSNPVSLIRIIYMIKGEGLFTEVW